LRHGAAPSLPATYTHAIDGTLIGPNVGSCGTAAYFGTPIVVADIATDPLWKDYKELALSHGLQACWSVPIISTKGIVLGTTAVYYPNPRTPSYEEMDLIERAAHVAGIAIERKRAEQTLVHNALHDSLTNLPNRALFLDRLQHEFTRAKRHDDYKFAVLFIDIDGFKTVNDSLGHAIGDDLIIEVGRRLTRFLRHDDIIARQESNADEDSLARLGGDEFTVLLEDIKDPSDAIRAAQRIQNALTAPHMLDGHEVYTSVSIGIALSSATQNTAEDLLRDADIAMYRAKSLGKARCEVFDVTMHRHAVERLRLETDLRIALDRKEFCVHYQPIISVDTRKLTGFEALVRWNRPQVGLVGPDKFIKVAEETGLIIAIDKWVLEEACRQMQMWHSLYAFASELTISVNLSPKQFTKPNLAQEIHAVVDSTKLSPSFLNLELTETIAMSDAEKTRTILSELKAVGARLSIDDFGTGYSSLSYLRRFPVDILKIDRSFVSNMNVDDNRKIVATMIALAHNLGLRVVAEGTETEEQFRQLQDLKCELAQGYLFSPPLSVQEATDFLLTRTAAKGAVSGSNSSSQI
jgi:diguanylate cyclase (GGDEF)-like protein